jgi:hypothetical protein
VVNFKDNDFLFIRGGIRVAKDRECDYCSFNVVEDEYHVAFDCPFYNSLRGNKRFSMFFKGQAGGMQKQIPHTPSKEVGKRALPPPPIPWKYVHRKF